MNEKVRKRKSIRKYDKNLLDEAMHAKVRGKLTSETSAPECKGFVYVGTVE